MVTRKQPNKKKVSTKTLSAQKSPPPEQESSKPASVSKLLHGTSVLLWRSKWLMLRASLLHCLLILVLAWNATTETGAVNEASSVWLLVLLIIMSLSEIWLIRHVVANEPTRLKEGLYRGTAQVVPYSLLVVLALVQLIPLAAGLYLFQIIVIGGIAVHTWEQVLVGGIWLLFSLLSFYWLTTSALALYIVTLPDMEPLLAWRTARRLVRRKRLRVALRLLPIFVIITLTGYLLLRVAPAAWALSYNVWWIAVALLLPLAHTYCYKLYRSLT